MEMRNCRLGNGARPGIHMVDFQVQSRQVLQAHVLESDLVKVEFQQSATFGRQGVNGNAVAAQSVRIGAFVREGHRVQVGIHKIAKESTARLKSRAIDGFAPVLDQEGTARRERCVDQAGAAFTRVIGVLLKIAVWVTVGDQTIGECACGLLPVRAIQCGPRFVNPFRCDGDVIDAGTKAAVVEGGNALLQIEEMAQHIFTGPRKQV